VEARFTTPVKTGPGAHSAFYTTGGVDHPPPSSAEVKERVELYPCSLFGPSWLVQGWALPFTLVEF